VPDWVRLTIHGHQAHITMEGRVRDDPEGTICDWGTGLEPAAAPWTGQLGACPMQRCQRQDEGLQSAASGFFVIIFKSKQRVGEYYNIGIYTVYNIQYWTNPQPHRPQVRPLPSCLGTRGKAPLPTSPPPRRWRRWPPPRSPRVEPPYKDHPTPVTPPMVSGEPEGIAGARRGTGCQAPGNPCAPSPVDSVSPTFRLGQ